MLAGLLLVQQQAAAADRLLDDPDSPVTGQERHCLGEPGADDSRRDGVHPHLER